MTKAKAKIVAREADSNGYVRTVGTKVMVGDVELEGVSRLTLVAEPDNVWRATIECYAGPPQDLLVLADVYHRSSAPTSSIGRLLQRIRFSLFGWSTFKGAK